MSVTYKKSSDKEICKTHCDWIVEQIKEIKALLYHDDTTVRMNKNRAKSAINTAMYSLEELRLYIEDI